MSELSKGETISSRNFIRKVPTYVNPVIRQPDRLVYIHDNNKKNVPYSHSITNNQNLINSYGQRITPTSKEIHGIQKIVNPHHITQYSDSNLKNVNINTQKDLDSLNRENHHLFIENENERRNMFYKNFSDQLRKTEHIKTYEN